MMILSNYRQSGRAGSFLAVNNGTVEGCVANISFAPKGAGGGFVFENNAKIISSVSSKCIRGKLAKGFFVKNSGTVTASGYIAGKNARKVGKDGTEEYVFGNKEYYISSDEGADKIRKRLELDGKWNFESESGGKLAPDMEKNKCEVLGKGVSVIRIETAQDLKDMIENVNSGDKNAVCAQYLLVNDINMKGAKLTPIGETEEHPFSGIFDGNGKKIENFTIDCRNTEYGGFFGCTKDAEVANLSLDFVLKGNGCVTVGGMVGSVIGGSFENCRVSVSMTPGICCGGFCGRNSGLLRNCYVGGNMSHGIPTLAWVIPGTAALLALLTISTVMLVKKLTGNVGFNPEIIDPNQVPITKPSKKEDPPPAGTNRISLELNHDIYVRASTMVGEMDYVNPHRSTQDVVLRLCISDAELKKAGYDLVACKVRTQSEIDAEGYNPEKAYTVFYSSQRLQIGYKLSYCKLSHLPNGEPLKVGDYSAFMMIDAYDPVTNEKAIVNAQAVTTIHILDQ